ncbi:hypothetical protein Tco_1192620 [Tanacetum coccineum]
MPALEDNSIFDSSRDDEDDGAKADMNNLDTTIQEEPKKVIHALKDPRWIEAMLEELLQFKLQEIYGVSNGLKSALSLMGKIEEEFYVDDIIFGSTKKELCNAFEKLMHEKFQMSSMGELTFFLGYKCSRRRMAYLLCEHVLDTKSIQRFPSSSREKLGIEVPTTRNEAVYKELGDSLVRAATTASSLEAEQDSGNINKTQSKATPNESSPQGTNSGGGPWCQETMGETAAQTRFESVSKHSSDSLLTRGNTLRSDEDRLKLDELMALCTNLQNRVPDLEKTKTTQHNEIATQQKEIASLKRRVKKLEKKNRRIDAIDADDEITLVSVQNDADKEMFDVNALDGEEVFVKGVNDEVNVVEEVVGIINTTKLIIDAAQVMAIGKGKGILIELVKPTKKKDQISLDEEAALKLQAEFDKEERLAREKAEKVKEANIALIKTWDDIQAKIDADH